MSANKDTYFQSIDELRDMDPWSELDIPSVLLLGSWKDKLAFVYGATNIDLNASGLGPSIHCPIEFRLCCDRDGIWGCDVSILYSNGDEREELGGVKEMHFARKLRDPHCAAKAIRVAQKNMARQHKCISKLNEIHQGELADPGGRFEHSLCTVLVKVFSSSKSLSFVVLPGDAVQRGAEINNKLEEYSKCYSKRSSVFLVSVLSEESPDQNETSIEALLEANPTGERTVCVVIYQEKERTPFIGAVYHPKEDHALIIPKFKYLAPETCANSLTVSTIPYDDAIDIIRSKFAEMTGNVLPEIRKIIHEKLSKLSEGCCFMIGSKKELFRIVNTFSRSISDTISSPHAGVGQAIDTHLGILRKSLEKTKPKLFLDPDMIKTQIDYVTSDLVDGACWNFAIENVTSLREKEGCHRVSSTAGKLSYSLVSLCQKHWGTDAGLFLKGIKTGVKNLIAVQIQVFTQRFPELGHTIELKLVLYWK